MNNFKFIVIMNFIVQFVFILGGAAVAVTLLRPTLLWWWLLAPFFTFTYSSKKET